MPVTVSPYLQALILLRSISMSIYHFVYKTTHTNGKYYIGRHTTKNLNDGYYGSGKWVKEIKDKNQLNTQILCFVDNQKELLIMEQKYIDENFDDPLCMNFLKSSSGFDSIAPSKITTKTNKTIIKCPHCDKTGNPANMKRWHFDNCSVLTGEKHIRPKWDDNIKNKISKSHCKKSYTIYPPNGEPFVIDNINKFAQDNNLHHTNLYAVINGKMKTAYGYRIVRN